MELFYRHHNNKKGPTDIIKRNKEKLTTEINPYKSLQKERLCMCMS